MQPDRAGRFALLADPYGRVGGVGGMGSMGGAPPGAAGPVTLATLAVGGPAATATALPATLPAEPLPPAPAATRSTSFRMGMAGMRGGALPMSFTVDGRVYDPDRDDQIVTAGTTEEWTLTATDPLAHPFHLHAWPFVVVEASDGRPAGQAPQDVAGCGCASRSPPLPAAASTTATSSITRTPG